MEKSKVISFRREEHELCITAQQLHDFLEELPDMSVPVVIATNKVTCPFAQVSSGILQDISMTLIDGTNNREISSDRIFIIYPDDVEEV